MHYSSALIRGSSCPLSPQSLRAFHKIPPYCVKIQTQKAQTDRVTLNSPQCQTGKLLHKFKFLKFTQRALKRPSLTSYQNQSRRLSWLLPSLGLTSGAAAGAETLQGPGNKYLYPTQPRLDTPSAVGWSARLPFKGMLPSISLLTMHTSDRANVDLASVRDRYSVIF